MIDWLIDKTVTRPDEIAETCALMPRRSGLVALTEDQAVSDEDYKAYIRQPEKTGCETTWAKSSRASSSRTTSIRFELSEEMANRRARGPQSASVPRRWMTKAQLFRVKKLSVQFANQRTESDV